MYTVRTMRAYTGGGADLVWYGAAGDRTKTSITAFGILEEFRGVLVRDDYGGYTSYDQDLAGVQQCLAHVLRYLDDAHAIDTDAQAWARQVADALRGAIHEVNTARAADRTDLDTSLITRLRRRFDNGVAVGISTNLSRPWHQGNHPGLQLAKRLKRKAHQVWLFTTRLDVPPTNNGSESAIRGFKLAAKVQGCWRTLATLMTLPNPFLPDQRPQPRTPTHRRHPRCLHRQPLDATPDSMIHRGNPLTAYRSRSNSAVSADRFGRFTDRRESATPSNAPASRARAHSITCDEYKPSRRRTAPFSPFGAASYSATIASLYSAGNERREGRGDGPSSARGPDDRDDSSRPPPWPRRSSVDTDTRISDHALYREPLG